MKLKNKLIPISTILATTAIVAPIALTSCSQSMVMEDSTKPFTPDFEPYNESQIISQYQATKKYVEFAKKNPKNLVQDIRYGMRQEIFDVFDYMINTQTGSMTAAKIVNYSFGANNVKLGETTVCFPGEEPLDYPTLSLDMKIHLECELDGEVVDGETETYTNLYTLDADISYKNMIFFAEYGNPLFDTMLHTNAEVSSANQLGWCISFLDPISNYIALRNATGWKITSASTLVKEQTCKRAGAKSTSTKNVYNQSIEINNADMIINQLGNILSTCFSALMAGNFVAFDENFDYTFFPLFMSFLNYPTYYFGQTYSTPTIVSSDILSNQKGGGLGDGEYELKFDPNASVDTALYGWEYRYDWSFITSPISEEWDIGSITLAEDEDLVLPEMSVVDPENRRVLIIDHNAVIYDAAWAATEGDSVNIRVPAKIMSAEDYTMSDGYSFEELEKWDSDHVMFTLRKRLIKVSVPLYKYNTGTGKYEKQSEVITTVDVSRPFVDVYYNMK